MKRIILYIILLMPALAVAQSKVWLPAAPNAFNWTDVEKHDQRQVLIRFVNARPADFAAYRDTAAYTDNIDSLYKHLHVLDINGDKLDDIIFEGQDTGEGGLVQIFVNTGKGYKQVLEDKQGLQNIEWRNGKIITLCIDDWGCCSAYLNFEKKYNVLFDGGNIPVFIMADQASAVFDGILPDSLVAEPFKFTVNTANCRLRTRPVIDDNGFGPWQENNDSLRGTGNVVGLLRAGAQGSVIGKKAGKDSGGWWYIELDAYVPLQRSVFYENGNKIPAKKRGWVNSKDVKIN